MPDKRTHRSRGPRDGELFGPRTLPRLREAVSHLAWLLTRGYAEASALKLVGDRFQLAARQREALRRCTCSDGERDARAARAAERAALRGARVALDGFNVLTTVEVALGGGLVLLARDGCARDLASMHGSWRRVAETSEAVERVGAWLADAGAGECAWYVDAPVSNSGRLGALLRERAAERGWPWRVELVPDADACLVDTDAIVATADRGVLDRCGTWLNLARAVVRERVPAAWVVEL